MSVIAGTWNLNHTTSEAPNATFHFGGNESNLIDPDLRTLVNHHDIVEGGKYRSIVKLFIHYAGQDSEDDRFAMATGWLIMPDLLVTAAHNIYDWSQNDGTGFGRATEVKAYIGYNGKQSIHTPEVQFRAGARVVVPEKWLNSSGHSANDVAFIKVNRPFTGVRPFGFKDTPLHDQQVIGVVGYPADKRNGTEENGAQLYEEFRKTEWDLRKSSGGLLEYRINTYGGQCGAPVLLKGQSIAIGTHVCNGENSNKASIIGPSTNAYSEYISAFSREYPEATPPKPIPGVRYLNLKNETSEVHTFMTEESFWDSFKKVIRVGAPVVTSMGPLLGPIGGPVGAIVGTALGALDNTTEWEGLAPAGLAQEGENSAVHRAILNEAAVQAVFQSTSYNSPTVQDLTTKVEMKIIGEYRELVQQTEKILPRVLPAIGSAIQPLTYDILQEANEESKVPPVANGDALAIDAVCESTGSLTSTDGLIVGDFQHTWRTLMRPGSAEANSPQETLVSLDQKLTNQDGNSVEGLTGPNAELDILGKRALLGIATASVLREMAPVELEALGIFDKLKEVARKIAPTVVRYSPAVVRTVVPVVQSLV
ncbi:trypsin-like cysteine/serine peptidase domain-containing protein [Aspergillus karnatakaensis]|uniref:trypsin-like serine peptidase n=1 Tax=Aspergillus karnatakaensis TaxID=1810916 RepID=UPI003CCDF486